MWMAGHHASVGSWLHLAFVMVSTQVNCSSEVEYKPLPQKEAFTWKNSIILQENNYRSDVNCS